MRVKPEQRARGLGWLSAATNAGVALGPVIGSKMLSLRTARPGHRRRLLCVLNIIFALRYLVESRDMVEARSSVHIPGRSRTAVLRVLTHSKEPAPRLIWIYAIGIGAFQGLNAILALFLAARFGVTSAHDRLLLHVHRRHFGVDAGGVPRMGGRQVRRGTTVADRTDLAGDRTGGDAVHASDDRPGGVCGEARRDSFRSPP